MNIPSYNYQTDEESLLFIFTSESNRKDITKVIEYVSLGDTRYNLGFGDLIDGQINDKEISNNGDGLKYWLKL